MKFKGYSIVFLVFLMSLLNISFTCAQDTASNTVVTPATDSNIGEISKIINEIDESVKEVDKKISDILNYQNETAVYDEVKTDYEDDKRTFERYKAHNVQNIDAAMTLHSEIKHNSDKLSGLVQVLINRIDKIEDLKAQLEQKNKKLEPYKPRAFDSAALNKAMQNVIANIKRVNKSADNAKNNINSFQDRCIQLQERINSSEKSVSDYVSGLKSRIYDKTGPEMYSLTYLSELTSLSLFTKFFYGLKEIRFSIGDFLNRNFGILVFQIILIWLMSIGIRYTGKLDLELELTKKLLDYYFSASIFFALVITIPLLNNLSPAMQLIYNVVFMFTVLRLVPVIFGNDKFHKEVVTVVILMTLIYFFDFITLPQPIFRLFTAVVALLGAVMAYKSKFHEEFAPEGSVFCSFILKFLKNILVGVLGIVFISQFFGYSNLANHLLLITFKTLFTAITVWMFLQISDDIVYIILHNNTSQKIAFIKNHSSKLLWHFVAIIDTFIIISTFGAILAFWGLYDNSVDAINAITGFGFDIRGVNISIGRILWTFFAVYITFAISWLVRTLLEEDILPAYGIEKGVIASINRLVYYMFILLAFLFGLSALGVDIQNLTYIISALGVGIGFGLQNIVNNFASGIILLFERSIKVGDTVVVGGTWGTVKKLGLRATVIQTFENSEMIVPNSDLVASTVNNWSMSEKSARFSANVGVAYGTDTQKVSKILIDVALANSNVMKTPAPSVVFNEFGDSSLNFELRAWVSDIGIRASTKNEIMFAIDKAFKENGIEIPFPQRDVHIKSEK